MRPTRQGWCACRREGGCAGLCRTLTDEQYQVVEGRCTFITSDSRSICQHHHDVWLHRYKPQTCAACLSPLTRAYRSCPSWLAEQLQTPRGSFVHERPCYKEEVAKRKQAATAAVATPAAAAAAAAVQPCPMDVAEQANNGDPQPFVINVRHTRTALWSMDVVLK